MVGDDKKRRRCLADQVSTEIGKTKTVFKCILSKKRSNERINIKRFKKVECKYSREVEIGKQYINMLN